MFIVTFIISAIVLYIVGAEYFILKGIVMAVVATILEAISIKGLDNITVPSVLMILSYILF